MGVFVVCVLVGIDASLNQQTDQTRIIVIVVVLCTDGAGSLFFCHTFASLYTKNVYYTRRVVHIKTQQQQQLGLTEAQKHA